MMKPLRLLSYAGALLATLAPLASFGQYGEYIRGGRPGQSMGTYCVGEGVLQFQQGVTYRSFTQDAPDNSFQRGTFSTNHVVRYGVRRDFEVSAVLRYQRDQYSDVVTIAGPLPAGRTERGVSNTQLGFRYNVVDESDKVPSVAIQTRFLLRWQSEEYKRSAVGTSTIIAASKGLTDWMSLNGNVGFTHSGNAPEVNPFYVLAAGFDATDNLKFFVEGYGEFSEFDINFDAGVGYFLTKNVKLDLYGGREGFGDFEGDLPGVKDDWFVSGGITWRVGRTPEG